MNKLHERIAQNGKGLDEFVVQMTGLREEYKQRLNEKRKRDKIKEMVNNFEAERERKLA